MLRAFDIRDGKLQQRPIDTDPVNSASLTDALWLDLTDPDLHERELVESMYQGTPLPDAEDIEEIEASARLFVDEANIRVHSLFLYHSEGRARTASVAFTLNKLRLITSRDIELPDFRLMRMRCRRGLVQVNSAVELMLNLFSNKIDHLADVLEDLYKRLNGVSYDVLEATGTVFEFEDVIDQIALIEDTNGKVRLCLMDTQRSTSFLMRQLRQEPDTMETCREIMRDIESLLAHSMFVTDKVNFLMDSTQGFINIEQSKIIKTFSIAAVVFLPPTVIASIYGMNFEHMPELAWTFSYPLTLVLIVLSGIAPYWFFKSKGWL